MKAVVEGWLERAVLCFLISGLMACGSPHPSTRRDAGLQDGGGELVDAGGDADGGEIDAGRMDAGPSDAGMEDAGPSDAGGNDGGVSDGGVGPADISVTIDASASLPLKVGRGFNDQVANGSFRHDDPRYQSAVHALGVDTLRFPGGTVANFYDPATGKLITNHPSQNSGINSRLSAWASQLANRQGGLLPWRRFWDMTQATGVDRPLFVLNPYTTSATVSGGWASSLAAAGGKGLRWELGNELYMAAYRDVFPTVADYVSAAKAHANAVRAADPTARVAVPAAPYRFPGPEHPADQAWNQALATETFYDAVAMHLYVGVPDPSTPPTDARDYLLWAAAPGGAIDHRIDALVADYGASRPIWLTEWNWFGYQNTQWNDTTLNLLFVADAWARIALRPEVELSAYHVFASDAAWPVAIMADWHAQVSPKPVYRTPIYFVFALLRDASRGMQRQAEPVGAVPIVERAISVAGHSLTVSYPEVSLWVGWSAGPPAVRVLAVNHMEATRSVEMTASGPMAGALNALLAGGGRLRCLSGAAYDSKEHLTTDPAKQDEAAHIDEGSVGGPRIDLPPLSVCVALFGP